MWFYFWILFFKFIITHYFSLPFLLPFTFDTGLKQLQQWAAVEEEIAIVREDVVLPLIALALALALEGVTLTIPVMMTAITIKAVVDMDHTVIVISTTTDPLTTLIADLPAGHNLITPALLLFSLEKPEKGHLREGGWFRGETFDLNRGGFWCWTEGGFWILAVCLMVSFNCMWCFKLNSVTHSVLYQVGLSQPPSMCQVDQHLLLRCRFYPLDRLTRN